jgi:glyceraldehyde-3-phosphate dehydrogenase (NADP+)
MTLETLFPRADAVPAAHRLPFVEQREYLVNGELRVWKGPLTPVVSPVSFTDGGAPVPATIGAYPSLGEAEALECLAAAVAAWDQGRGAWPCMRVEDRVKAVARFAHMMKDRRGEIVRLLMWEIGKTFADACKEFDRTLEYIGATIDALKDLDRTSSRFQLVDGIAAQVRRAPFGVTLCMGPFNYPLNETFTTLIPALIMGNTVLFKPARYGVLLNRPLLEAFRDCFPPGVVNTLYGDGKVLLSKVMASGQVDVLAFIGSAATANLIEKQHPKPNRLRTVLGLNAKNPAIILDDADLALTVKECLLGSLSYNGQRCTALKLLFVQRGLAERFISEFSRAVDALKPGLPWDEGVQVTPLPEAGKPEWLQALVDDAVSNGARVANARGGERLGTFFFPTVVADVPLTSRLASEEQFGPVVPIVTFDDISEVLDFVAQSSFGQQASIFSTSADRVARLVDPLVNQVCRINLNCQCQRGPDVFPFTGRKDSAEGTLSVSDALRAFSIRTLVAAKQGPLNEQLLRTILEERKSSFLNTDFLF